MRTSDIYCSVCFFSSFVTAERQLIVYLLSTSVRTGRPAHVVIQNQRVLHEGVCWHGGVVQLLLRKNSPYTGLCECVLVKGSYLDNFFGLCRQCLIKFWIQGSKVPENEAENCLSDEVTDSYHPLRDMAVLVVIHADPMGRLKWQHDLVNQSRQKQAKSYCMNQQSTSVQVSFLVL